LFRIASLKSSTSRRNRSLSATVISWRPSLVVTVNFAGMITGRAPDAIAAECVTQGEVDISFSASMKYADGVIATIDCGFNSFSWTGSELIGTRGVITMPETFSGNPGIITVTTKEGRQEITVAESDRFLLEVEDFSDAILNNRPPLVSLDETLRNMRIIDRLLQAVNLV
ncbi:MAG TPA: hypothetical protein VHY08_06575, partial [Bacillota bacterium]|nr:hypothetical protein [Bacillota bacterium]